MFVNYEYERDFKAVSEYGKTYAKEYQLIREFASNDYGVIYFEYEDIHVSASACVQLNKFVKKENLPLFVKRRQNRVYIVKEDYNKMIAERNND